MAKDIHPARGMRDILPEEKALREQTLARLRAHYARYGYREIETPAIEDLERLSSGQGGENEKLIFKILRRGLSPDATITTSEAADLGLRYDLTLPLARFYATNPERLGPVFRSMQIGPVWRAERPQKGRFRQFLQCDIDLIGEESILAETELITATLTALDQLGVGGCTVRINDRRLLAQMLDRCGIDGSGQGRVLVAIDKLDKIGLSGVHQELHHLNLAPGAADQVVSFLEAAGTGSEDKFLSQLANESQELFRIAESLQAIRKAVKSALPEAGIVFDPSLVRGMAYYTGAVFEIAHPSTAISLAGGGRYDNMIGRFTGSPVPACGFSIGFERIIGLLSAPEASTGTTVALIYSEGCLPERVLAVQAQLISQGLNTRLQSRPRRLGRMLDSLAAEGFTHYVLIDPDTTSVLAEELEPINLHG